MRQRLAAILAADAAGYSRLMACDERATVTALAARYPGWYLYLMSAAQHFGGRSAQALEMLDRVLAVNPDLVVARLLRIAALRSLDREQVARAVAAALRSAGRPA